MVVVRGSAFVRSSFWPDTCPGLLTRQRPSTGSRSLAGGWLSVPHQVARLLFT